MTYVQTDYSCDRDPAHVAPACLNQNPIHGWLSQIRTTWHSYDAVQNGPPVWHTRMVSENGYTYDNVGQRLTNLVMQMVPGAGGAPQYTGGTANATNEVVSVHNEKYETPSGVSRYDALNRLTNVDYGDGQTQVYTFDAMGNRLSKQDSVSGTTNYAVDAANRLTGTTGTGASTYTNDADGNTLTGGGRTNTWDSQNRLVSCILGSNTSTFKYGADGLRRQKTTNSVTTDYAYDGTMMVREGVASSGTLSQVKATYLCGPRGPEYRRDDTQMQTDGQGHTFNGKASWYVYDGLGSVVGEVDPLGNLTSSPKYDVYGAVRGNGGTATTKQGFVGGLGHLSEAETGLVYMRARYMDPQTGRFVSQDTSYDGPNWFIYCDDNPISNVDADGKSVKSVLEEVGAIVVGLSSSQIFRGFFQALLCTLLLPESVLLCAVSPAQGAETFGGLMLGAIMGLQSMTAGINAANEKSFGGGLLEVIGFAVGYAATLDLVVDFMEAVDDQDFANAPVDAG